MNKELNTMIAILVDGDSQVRACLHDVTLGEIIDELDHAHASSLDELSRKNLLPAV